MISSKFSNGSHLHDMHYILYIILGCMVLFPCNFRSRFLLLLGGVQKLRRPNLALFWPPTPFE